ncbi:hypothetical protein [Methylibium petroleiphilum]|uniref:Uncharacterized protein n=1 Tax=Methylibium petroleiphilum (strain ATCC BAA-1232 / LMG 22953 / PM1) TaxID=420662 RepID=A2SCP6_METPP|nr:hypothetical protein [Methylibium petroleiphilum]ABM93335.1 hypothetical protein Mpe_A0373 [Methylibium petroleiphilum PM1]
MTMRDLNEWSVLYGRLLEELAVHGRNDPFGDGDFYLIDDDYGSKQQKIEVTSSGSFTPALVTGIQRILASFPGWEVIVSLPSDNGVEHGFSVTATSCVESRGA